MSANAIGVDRDPGATTASVTPHRTHSSTNVAQNVAVAVEPIGSSGVVTSSSWLLRSRSHARPAGTAPTPADGPACDDREVTPRPEPDEQLHAVRSGTGPRIVLVHGFTQTPVSWAPVAAELDADHEVVRVEAPGHGRSGAVRAGLTGGARLLGEAGGRATYVGYSMGGRLALRLALDRPELVERLVLLGVTAGIEDPRERSDRRAADDALATSIETNGVDQFLERWLAQPLFDDLSPRPEDLAARRANTPDGLASSLRLAGVGTMDPPWWDQLHRMGAPTIVLAGGNDAKFTALGLRLVDGIGPTARFVTVPDSGHAAHLQRPEFVAAMIRSHEGPA